MLPAAAAEGEDHGAAGCCEMETTSRVKESEKFREYVKEQDAVRGRGGRYDE